MYKAMFMSFDGSKQIEGNFKSISEAWDYILNCGSRWYFYPFTFVVTDKTIASSFDDNKFLEKKHIKTVVKMFKNAYQKAPENCGLYEYLYWL